MSNSTTPAAAQSPAAQSPAAQSQAAQSQAAQSQELFKYLGGGNFKINYGTAHIAAQVNKLVDDVFSLNQKADDKNNALRAIESVLGTDMGLDAELVDKLVNDVFSSNQTDENKNAALQAIKSVLNININSEAPYSNTDTLKNEIVRAIKEQYSSVPDKFAAFMNAIRKPEIGLAKGNPLILHQSQNYPQDTNLLKERIVSAIEKQYPSAPDKFAAFMNAIRKLEIGLAKGNPLILHQSDSANPLPNYIIKGEEEGSLEFRVGKLCEHMASKDVTSDQRAELITSINLWFGNNLWQTLTPENLSAFKDLLIKAIETQYHHDTPDKFEAFLGTLESQMGYNYPLKTYKSQEKGKTVIRFIFNSSDWRDKAQEKLKAVGISSKAEPSFNNLSLSLENPKDTPTAMLMMGFPEDYKLDVEKKILNVNLTTQETPNLTKQEAPDNVIVDNASRSITLKNNPLLSNIEIKQDGAELKYVLHVKTSDAADKANLAIVKSYISNIKHAVDEGKSTVTLESFNSLVQAMCLLDCSDAEVKAVRKAIVGITPKHEEVKNSQPQSEVIDAAISGISGELFVLVREPRPSGVFIIQTQKTHISTSTPCAQFTFKDKSSEKSAAENLKQKGIEFKVLDDNTLELTDPSQIESAMSAMGFTPDGIRKTVKSSPLLHAASKDLAPKIRFDASTIDSYGNKGERITLIFPYGHDIKDIQLLLQDGKLKLLITPHPESYIKAAKETISKIGNIRTHTPGGEDTSIELINPQKTLPMLKELGCSNVQIQTVEDYITELLKTDASIYYKPYYNITGIINNQDEIIPHVKFTFYNEKRLIAVQQKLDTAKIGTSRIIDREKELLLTNPAQINEAMQIMKFREDEIKDAVDILSNVVNQFRAAKDLKEAAGIAKAIT